MADVCAVLSAVLFLYLFLSVCRPIYLIVFYLLSFTFAKEIVPDSVHRSDRKQDYSKVGWIFAFVQNNDRLDFSGDVD